MKIVFAIEVEDHRAAEVLQGARQLVGPGALLSAWGLTTVDSPLYAGGRALQLVNLLPAATPPVGSRASGVPSAGDGDFIAGFLAGGLPSVQPTPAPTPAPVAMAEAPKPQRYTLRIRGSRLYRRGGARRTLTLWAIRFEGAEFDLPDVIGSCYLAFLLLNGHRATSFAPGELIAAVMGVGPTEHILSDEAVTEDAFDSEGCLRMALGWSPDAAQAVLDIPGIERVGGLIKVVTLALQEVESDPAQQTAANLYREKQETLIAYLLANTKPGPRGSRLPKAFAKGSATKQPDLIRKHLAKVLACVRSHDRGLFLHLQDRDIFRFGAQNYYQPPRHIVWH